jgi:hypothetical protein
VYYPKEGKNMIAREEIVRRVKNGVAWLDSVEPDWVEDTYLEDLNCEHPETGVYAQVFGRTSRPIRECDVVENGFTFGRAELEPLDFEVRVLLFESLTLLWKAAIQSRKDNQ